MARFVEFDFIELKKSPKYKDISDEDLVKMAQKDIDEYRIDCRWECGKCNASISYIDSLIHTGEIYVHDIRASNVPLECKLEESSGACKRKMTLIRDDKREFISEAFNELFARYQMWIVHASRKCDSIDAADEVYCELCVSFSKIVGMFARGQEFAKTSEKWFSSFFFTSIQNKISDIQKTRNYQKRSPLIKCEVCDSMIGKVTSKHLISDGHENFVQEIIVSIGYEIISNSGEIGYYKRGSLNLRNRCLFVGASHLSKMTSQDRKNEIKSRAISNYIRLYPNAPIKNNLMSINTPLDSESDSTIEDVSSQGVIQSQSSGENIIDEIFFKESANLIVQYVYIKNPRNQQVLNKYFDEEMKEEEIIDILKEIIHDKVVYTRMKDNKVQTIKNSDLDRTYGEKVKEGLTSKLIRFIRSDENCRKELLNLSTN